MHLLPCTITLSTRRRRHNCRKQWGCSSRCRLPPLCDCGAEFGCLRESTTCRVWSAGRGSGRLGRITGHGRLWGHPNDPMQEPLPSAWRFKKGQPVSGVYTPPSNKRDRQLSASSPRARTSTRLSVVRNWLSFIQRLFMWALHLQWSSARFAFVARKFETRAGRNCSVQFRRFK